jgi:hypothetical protein
MVNGKLVEQSRWVLQALWVIAAALMVMILMVRTRGILSEPQFLQAFTPADASAAFALPVLSSAGTLHSFDVAASGDRPPVPIRPGASIPVVAGTTVTITGWAFDAAANADYSAIGGRVSGSPQVYSALVRLARPDVAAALHNTAALDSGFTLSIDTSHLPRGRHEVAVHALRPGGRTAADLAPAIAIDITSPSALRQNTDAIDSVNGVVVDAGASAAAPVTVLRSYRRLSVSGWGFVTSGTRLPSGVTILVDGNPAAAARYGLSRTDVAHKFHDVRLTRSGFEGTIPTDSLPAGAHEIQFQLSLSDGTTVPAASTLHIVLI